MADDMHPASPFGTLPIVQAAIAPGLVLKAAMPRAALIMAGRTCETIATALPRAFGVPLPSNGYRTAADDRALLCFAPGKWLAVDYSAAPKPIDTLAAELSDCAAVTDQSDGLGFLSVSGARAARTLAKLMALDLHQSHFGTGRATAIQVGSMRAYFACVDDAPTYEMAVARSMADSLLHSLAIAGREFGVRFETTI